MPQLIAELSDTELVRKWVQAMHCYFETKYEGYEDSVRNLRAEIHRRKLGLRSLNVVMEPEHD